MRTRIAGFDWDHGNWPKCGKHGLSKVEIESVFHGQAAIHPDPTAAEERLRAIGQTGEGRFVSIVFALREIEGDTFIRSISARYMHKREVKRYEQ